MNELKVAGCQIDISIGDVDSNCEKVLSYISIAADQGAKLITFPECALTGCCFNSTQEVESGALEITGYHLLRVLELCDKLKVFCILGFIEREGKNLFNTAGLFGPNYYLAKYRKIHLPILGVDRFVQSGNLGFPVFELPIGRIGLNICYDQRFPESARVLMLKGAQLVVVPTNEPDKALDVCNLLTRARAFENRVFYMWVNRVGNERGVTFLGSTQIVDCYGNIIAIAGNSSQEIIYADLELSIADQKKSVFIPGEYEIDVVKDRIPEYYQNIVKDESSLQRYTSMEDILWKNGSSS